MLLNIFVCKCNTKSLILQEFQRISPVFLGKIKKNIVPLRLQGGQCVSEASATRRAELASNRLFVSPKVEKKVLIIYAPRKMRERSERNPKGGV